MNTSTDNMPVQLIFSLFRKSIRLTYIIQCFGLDVVEEGEFTED